MVNISCRCLTCCQGSSKSTKYDVFLSFRGPDIRKGFVAHLYSCLEKSGVNTFLDRKKLETGKSIDLGLTEAIESSAILIPIFSKNYAESAWCLKEVTTMCKSGRLVIPVFLDVKPKDLRHPEDSLFAEAFREHQNKGEYNENTIVEWKETLREVGNLSGWSLQMTNGNEAELVELVVQDAKTKLRKVKLSKL